MICPRCRGDEEFVNSSEEKKEDEKVVEKKLVKMKDIKRKGGFHKQTKYICPECDFKKMIRNR
jgi:hypothetical protein